MLTKADLVRAARRNVGSLRRNRIADYPGGPKVRDGLGWANEAEVAEAVIDAVLKEAIEKTESPRTADELRRVLADSPTVFVPVTLNAAGDAICDPAQGRAFPCAALD